MYSIPAVLANLPPILHAIATRETIYRISLSRLMTNFPTAQQGKATIQVMHEEDMKILDEIAEGGFSLLTPSLDLIPTNESGKEVWSSTMDYNPTMHEGSWLDMVQDTEKLDDIINDRLDRGLTGWPR